MTYGMRFASTKCTVSQSNELGYFYIDRNILENNNIRAITINTMDNEIPLSTHNFLFSHNKHGMNAHRRVIKAVDECITGSQRYD
jgi:hypothetical protein